MQFTNNSNIDLPLAVWLASGAGYDLEFDPNVISATTLLNPLKSIVLSRRMQMEGGSQASVDIADLVPAKLGTSVHEAVEQSWLTWLEPALETLGYSENFISRVKVNPVQVNPGDIPVYIEQRTEREVDGLIISGKFDFVMDGTVMDIKTTKTYNWINGSNNERYQLQGSMYRWLNPTIVTSPYMVVQYVFTDWSPIRAQADKDYPKDRVLAKKLPLLTLQQVEEYVTDRVSRLRDMFDMDQQEMPLCTPKELWQDPPKWAYYKNPQKTDRATRLYDLAAYAYAHNAKDGGTGLVIERKSEPVFCRYCKARPVCLQAEEYLNAGLLKA